MICEYCGSQLAEMPGDGKCPNCSAPVVITRNVLVGEIPCGLYTGVSSTLALQENGLVVHTGILSKSYLTKMRYGQVIAVKLYGLENDRMGSIAHIVLRGTGQDMQMPERNKCPVDKTHVCFGVYQEDLFYHIFYVLKAVAPESAVFTVEGVDADFSALLPVFGNFDFDRFYREYVLNRRDARAYLRKRFGLKRWEATALVNRLFYEKDTARYAQDPQEALRDLSKIVQSMDI